ncbi:hypothetical protein V502_07008 [Pseudogymnoascus sp. VKM F-4520 (FW-2644)]|nr:hypothetical protein V502_07008 [Pseudogymnoascus sp. VKM F-4520 (FW-2644)]
MDAPSTDKATKGQAPSRKWTDFEATILMNLIIHNIHKTGLEKDEFTKLSDSTAPRHKHRNTRRAKEVADPDKFKYVDVATALNRALHKSDYTHDIPVEEVEKLLHFFLRDRKGSIAVIDRQPTARLTRSTNRIWRRGLNFLGTKAEWEDGRKAAEEVKRREDQERRLNVGNAGAINTGANATGVADGWGDDTATAPAGDGWGTAANENNTDASAAVGVWGDVMEVDTPVAAANNPKANHESSRVEAISGAWGSGTADSSTAVVTNAADPWGAGVESTVESNSATAAWGEPAASETAATTAVATAADWSAHEDPFATPLPPRLRSYTNTTTAPSNAWDVPGASSATSGTAVVESDPWNQNSASSSDPISDVASNAWGTITDNSTTALPSKTTDGPGKTANTAADPWGTSAESALPSLSTVDTAADPWGIGAASSVIQPSAMDWSTEVSDVTTANSFAAKTVEQVGPAGTPVDKPATMNFDDSWGEPVTDAQNQPVTVAAGGWGEPIADTTYQPVTTTAGGWGDNFEKPQGRLRISQTDTTAELDYGDGAPATINGDGKTQWSKPAAPVPPGWGPEPTAVENPVVDSGNASLWASVVEEVPQPSGMNPSDGFQNSSRQGSKHDKTPNKSVQGVQVAGPGINPDRLAMLAAAGTDDDGVSNFETAADEELSRGRKSFKTSATLGSNDNAIPLKFNRLAGR